jgi:hypothetical protein
VHAGGCQRRRRRSARPAGVARCASRRRAVRFSRPAAGGSPGGRSVGSDHEPKPGPPEKRLALRGVSDGTRTHDRLDQQPECRGSAQVWFGLPKGFWCSEVIPRFAQIRCAIGPPARSPPASPTVTRSATDGTSVSGLHPPAHRALGLRARQSVAASRRTDRPQLALDPLPVDIPAPVPAAGPLVERAAAVAAPGARRSARPPVRPRAWIFGHWSSLSSGGHRAQHRTARCRT